MKCRVEITSVEGLERSRTISTFSCDTAYSALPRPARTRVRAGGGQRRCLSARVELFVGGFIGVNRRGGTSPHLSFTRSTTWLCQSYEPSGRARRAGGVEMRQRRHNGYFARIRRGDHGESKRFPQVAIEQMH